jgi:MSHA biogenesis protein MshN
VSLLNDALRGAEQQRKAGHVPPAAYIGQGASAGPRRRGGVLQWLTLVVLVVVLAFAGAIIWQNFSAPQVVTSSVPEPVISADAVSGAELKRVERTPPPMTEAKFAEQDSTPAKEAPEAPEARLPLTIPSGAEPLLRSEATPEPAAQAGRENPGKGSKAQEVADRSPLVADQSTAAPEPGVQQAPAGPEKPEAESPSATTIKAAASDSQDQEPQRAVVKQQEETPALLDSRTDLEIRTLLSRGRVSEAAQMLADLLRQQPAPKSRGRFARYLLLQDQPERALDWLPVDTTRENWSLRLLRARALLASGQAGEALTTLESEVPPVSASAEYSVTLATLLHQQGRSNAAVTRWAELIRHDNTRGPWWVGLAIALEADRQPASAVKACEQAMRLPGLAEALENYCRQRVLALRAG